MKFFKASSAIVKPVYSCPIIGTNRKNPLPTIPSPLLSPPKPAAPPILLGINDEAAALPPLAIEPIDLPAWALPFPVRIEPCPIKLLDFDLLTPKELLSSPSSMFD